MTELPKPTSHPPIDGVKLIELSSWHQFVEYVTDVFLERRNYIWRGHGSDEWLLESTLDRALKANGVNNSDKRLELHLESFKYAVRGRRGQNPAPIATENEWWALGQHHGLFTPLLDWTRSPFVAAYFAFSGNTRPSSGKRAIFTLATNGVKQANKRVEKQHKDQKNPPVIEFISPLSDDNARLVNQGGLFTRVPSGTDIASWVRKYSPGELKGTLVKLTIPDTERERVLRELNRMNINHLSLFPDLYGASKYCNYDLEIDHY